MIARKVAIPHRDFSPELFAELRTLASGRVEFDEYQGGTLAVFRGPDWTISLECALEPLPEVGAL